MIDPTREGGLFGSAAERGARGRRLAHAGLLVHLHFQRSPARPSVGPPGHFLIGCLTARVGRRTRSIDGARTRYDGLGSELEALHAEPAVRGAEG